MGKALYRKYRSKKLSEIVGQEHITVSLDNALKNNKISHAYLFTGPRGVGKTSIARILAHEINGLPYEEDATHLDIIEIDAASNRRIDEIRDLRDKIHNAPSSAKYKVYIIDEVHMLTKEAFNALLKTLEEPPAHAVFILATTESHKLPETIVSRTQRYAFKPVAQNEVVAHLRSIAISEDISIDDEALRLIADHGQGSFRDSISLLDQVRNSADMIDRNLVLSAVGMANEELISSTVQAVRAKDFLSLVTLLADIRSGGYNAGQFAKQLGAYLREQVVNGQGDAGSVAIMKALLEVPSAQDPAATLELVLLEQMVGNKVVAPAADIVVPATPVAKVADPKVTSPEPVKPQESKPDLQPKPEPAPPPKEKVTVEEAPAAQPSNNGEDIWQQTLHTIKPKHNTLYGLARMAEARINGDKITLAFAFPFHLKRMNDTRNKEIVLDALLKVSGRAITLECLLADSKPIAKKADAPKTVEHVAAISNIFGDAEVLES